MDRVQYTTLVDVLKQVPDPRNRKGRRHRLVIVLSLIAAAMASAQRTPQAIARWLNEHRLELLAALPPSVSRLPCASTIRRVLALVDVACLEQALAALAPVVPPAAPEVALTDLASPLAPPAAPEVALADVARPEAPPLLQGLALDGKAIRGVGRDGHPCHLVSLVEHGSARVLGQVAVERKRDERSAVPKLLEGRDLTNTLITLDALHTLRPTAHLIRKQGGHFLMIVKKNQARLYEYLELLFRLPPLEADHEVWDTVGPRTEKGHGRLETRTLTCGNAHIEDVDWPHVQQVVRRECERIILKTGQRTHEVSYALVSLRPEEGGAAVVEAFWRGHWTIENRLHYVRDVTLGEDAGHAARGATAHVLAALRNGLLALFRQARWTSVPDALAHYGASVARAFTLIGLSTNLNVKT
jgi:predicted transposase YbfD/YdcC